MHTQVYTHKYTDRSIDRHVRVRRGVHDVHVWSLNAGHPALACHLVIDKPSKAKDVLAGATAIAQIEYKILHTTIQVPTHTFTHTCTHAYAHTHAHTRTHKCYGA